MPVADAVLRVRLRMVCRKPLLASPPSSSSCLQHQRWSSQVACRKRVYAVLCALICSHRDWCGSLSASGLIVVCLPAALLPKAAARSRAL